MSNNRMNRIDEEVKREVSQIISHELSDPRITGIISITKVKVTPDLRFARIYVSLLNCQDIDKTMKALKSASGFIRTEISKRLVLRTTPEIIFEKDDSIEYGAHINQVLKEISSEDAKI